MLSPSFFLFMAAVITHRANTLQNLDNAVNQKDFNRKVDDFLRNACQEHHLEGHPVKDTQPKAVEQKTDEHGFQEMGNAYTQDKPLCPGAQRPLPAVICIPPFRVQENGPFGATKNPQTSIKAPMSIPIQGPNKYPPAAIGRPVSVISVTVERGIRKKDRTTPNAIRMELVVSRRRLIFEVFMETSPDLCLFGAETGITLC